MSAKCGNALQHSPFAPCLASLLDALLSVPKFPRPFLVLIVGWKTFPRQKGPPLTIFLHLSCLFPDELLIWCW